MKTPESVFESDRAKLYWHRFVITEKSIVANKPDIVLVDRLGRRAFIVVTIPQDDNLLKPEKENTI